MVVLAIGAHPDDIEFGCFGTLARLSKVHDIHIIILTLGELAGSSIVRMEECRQSAKLINATLHFLDYEEGDISVNASSILKLRNHIRSINPNMIFTLYPQDTHQDHRNTSQITVSACRDWKPDRQNIDEILFYEVVSTTNFRPNMFYDVTDFFPLKKSALSIHSSQNAKICMDLKVLEALSLIHANNCGYKDRLFEAFYLYKAVK